MKRRIRKIPDLLPPAPSEEEEKMTARMRILMHSLDEASWSISEKEALRQRVEDSVSQKTERFFSRRWMAMAASIAILLFAGTGYFLSRRDQGSAMRKAAASLAINTLETRLQLADKRVIRLSQQNSDLIYTQHGSQIRIDSSSIIDQKVAGAEQEFNTLTVPYGKRSTITLVDGTRIWLNSGSKLIYPAAFDGKTREVFLEGQAYFSVSHSADVPFYVHSKNMKIQVLGTEFDVSAYDDDVQTAAVLVKGSIELTVNQNALFGAQNKKIAPATMAVYNPATRGLETSQVSVESYTSWKDGYLIFNKAPLADIFKKLSRYYKADIELGSADARKATFTGSLHLQEDINLVLEAISLTTSLNYQQTERRYIFR